MKTNFTQFASLMLALTLLFSSCASSYKTVRPENLLFNAASQTDNINFNYKYDVYTETGNKKYAKKEKKKLVQVVAVKITNNTGRAIDATQDLQFFVGQQQIMPMSPEVVHNQIKQSTASHLLYLLLLPVQLTTTESVNGMETERSSFPIGVILGPALAGLNMAISATANKNMLNDLQTYNLANRKILPGETVYGLFGLHNSGYNPITVKLAQ